MVFDLHQVSDWQFDSRNPSNQVVVRQLWDADDVVTVGPADGEEGDGVVRCEGAEELGTEELAAFLGERSFVVGGDAFEESKSGLAGRPRLLPSVDLAKFAGE